MAAGVMTGARLEERGARREVAARRAGSSRPVATASWTRQRGRDRSGRVAATRSRRAVASSGVVASTGTTASAPSGSGAPGRDADRRSAADGDVGRLPGADIADDLESDRVPRRWRCGRVGSDRIA